MATKIGNLITLDGQFTDWPADDSIMTSGNTVTGYQVYGALLNDATLGNTYVIGIDATATTDQVIAANTFIYLNTDQNTATGYDPFGDPVGAEYEVQFSVGSNNVLQPYLYSVTAAGVATLLNGGAPLNYGISSNGESVELAIPRALLTPAGGVAPTSISFDTLINNGAAALPSVFTGPEYTITDPSALVAVDHTVKKVGIVYSATTAALYFGGGQAGETAYSDLFMAAQHQAEAAGVSYDILTEADLTNVAKLAQYSALIFPDFQDVQSSQVSAIASALYQVVYNYHVPIITAGNFMTNDQLGNALSGNSYANMQSLLNVTLGASATATYSVTPDPTALASNNPVIAGYTAGQLIGGASGQFAGTTVGYYTNTGYQTFSGYTQPATTLADINIQGGATLPGVVQTTTGGTNTVFSTTQILADSNLLQHAIQNAVFGTTPSLAMDITRFAGVLNSRQDTEDAQFPEDVNPSANGSPAGTLGIYDELIPMLQQWEQQYDFVGTYFINVGDNANPANGNSTNWSVSLPYYDKLLQMGNEIGSHSYTHLINPPTVDANGNPIPNIVVNTATGPETINSWSENTNTLYVTPPANGSAPNWTFSYEFGTGNSIMESNIGIPIAGAAVPGAADTVATSDQIEQYYQTASLPAGVTGYVEGGWTGAGSGAPNAFGYIDPSDTGSVYIAPNITFDFTEIQYDNKTPTQALADWESLFNQLSANSETPVIVWPWHDYGPTNWSDNGAGTPGPGYTEAMYTDFIAYAYNAGYEFVTAEDLAARIAAEQAATLKETTNGNVITATVTPAPTKLDLGAMALNVVNGTAGQVIQNAGSWYAYDAKSVFLPYGGGTFTVTLGTTQDDVTHIDSLAMRADLHSVTGDGSNLTYSFTGDGTVDIHVKTPGTNVLSVLASAVGTGAGPVSATLLGDDLKLVFNDGPLGISSTSPQGVPVQHNVTITEGTTAVSGAAFNFAPQNQILFQNDNGQAAVWQVNGTAIGASSLVGPNPGSFWSLVGTGAFFSGDTEDYLWRGSDGSIDIWQMSGTTLGSQSGVIAYNPGTSWLIAGTGDFYGDGHTDILWQNDNGSVALWDMNGTTISQAGEIGINPGPTWHIKGNGDFYGDGHTDILWQNDDGSVALWEMNGTTISQSGVVAANPGPTWHIKGTGDFYGDGHTDILWQNDNGSVALWKMNGTTITQSGVIAANPGPTWHIVGTGDFNGDGKTDIAWRNNDGSVAVWDMNGTTIAASAVLANPGVSWNAAGTDSMRFIYPTATDTPLAATPSVPDEFVLTSLAPGSQTITGFDPMQDVIEFSKALFASFTQVQAATSAITGGAMIGLGNGSSLLLPGVNSASLHASNFAWA